MINQNNHLWLFVVICGYLWLFVVICGYLWLFVVILVNRGYLWLIPVKNN